MACSTCKTVQWNKHDSAPYAMFEQNLTFQDNKHDSAPYAMFEQSVLETDPQLYNIITTLLQRVTTNERNLINMGNTDTYFGNKVTEIDSRLAGLESRPSGQGWTKSQIEQIFIDYYGDDIQRHDQQLTQLGSAIVNVKGVTENNRLAIDRNSENLVQVGNSITDIWNNITRIDSVLPTLGGGGISLPLIGGIGTTGLIVGGLALYLLTRKK